MTLLRPQGWVWLKMMEPERLPAGIMLMVALM